MPDPGGPIGGSGSAVRIAVASGKGGTGKTTIAVNLALGADRAGLVDCDVEEPNCHLFLGLPMEHAGDVTVTVPVIDPDLCLLCGECASFCRYHALAMLPAEVLVLENLCHGCGGCSLVCPTDAITERERVIGRVESAAGASVTLIHGLLDVGEATATRVITAVKQAVDSEAPAAHDGAPGVLIHDAPPGAACPMMHTVAGCDYAILVTEPTPFGRNDLRIAVEVVRRIGVPLGVVINRDGSGDDAVARYCRDEGIPILLRIPDDRGIAELYSVGTPFSLARPEWRDRFRGLLERVVGEVRA